MTALALKYRPSTFDDLVGQLHAAKSLQNAIEHGRIGHAYLFHGSRGVGKTSTARILSKALNCVRGPTISPCGICENCREITSGISLDVIEMDAASNRGIEHIRELRESVRFSPMKSRFKVYIIDEVHMLTNESFNALLKTLEEPPAHVVFILATTEIHKIPETILSRCQSYAFRKFNLKEIAGRLQHILNREKIPFEEDALIPVAQKAEGSMRDSISLLDQVLAYCGGEKITLEAASLVLGLVSLTTFSGFSEAIRTRNLKEAVLIINRIHEEGYQLRRFLWDFLEFIKNISLVRQGIDDARLLGLAESHLQELKHLASHWDAAELVLVYETLFQLYGDWSLFQTARSGEIKASFEIALVRIFHKLNLPSASALLKKISRLSAAMQAGETFEDETPSAGKAANEPPRKDGGQPATGKQSVDALIQKEFLAKEETSPINPDIFN